MTYRIHILLKGLMLFSTLSGFSQYLGGNADGYAFTKITQSSCSPIVVTPNLFVGGNADGSSTTVLTQSVCPAIVPPNVYLGGNSDGYAVTTLTQTSCPTLTVINFYFGGNADGSSFTTLTQSVCPTNTLVNFYLGGNADGFAKTALTQSVCPSNTIINVFAGGNADGFAYTTFTQTTCFIYLPIELLSFQAKCFNQKAMITWETATETNSNYFNIERSIDATSFEAIAKINAAGNSNQTIKYAFVDERPLPDLSYYRLKQVDNDKSFKYFSLIDFQCIDSETGLSIYPNPSTGIFHIIGAEINSEVIVTNTIGKEILKQKTITKNTEINLSRESNAVYYIQIKTNEKSFTKMVILNQ